MNNQNYAKKIFLTQITMITHLETDILECKVKWALVSITTNKSSGGDRVPVELFQILKDLKSESRVNIFLIYIA